MSDDVKDALEEARAALLTANVALHALARRTSCDFCKHRSFGFVCECNGQYREENIERAIAYAIEQAALTPTEEETR